MTASIQYNPYVTTNASGFFASVSDGFVQGVAMDDPSYRNWLAGGILGSAETIPMWGGVAINEAINDISIPLVNQPNPAGGIITRALNVTTGAAGQITGFSVFNQAHAMVITPQSQVPLSPSGGPVNFYRLGSRARIPVACSLSLISALLNNSVQTQVSWDYVAQELVPYTPAYVANPITGATWSSASGGRATFTVTNDLTAVLAAGSIIDVSGVVASAVPAGGSYNGTWTVVSVGATTIVVTMPISGGTYTSGGSVAAGGGALPVVVEQVQQTNCKVVSYSTSTGYANWNNNGACALIRL